MADTPTPGNPGTYLPIPGQAQNLDPSNNDAANAARIKSQNSTPQQGAATINDISVDGGTGKIFTGVTTPIVDATIQKIQEFTDTATQAKGPKGDKGEQGLTGPRGPAGPVGPAGKDGIQGKDGVVDYDKIRDMIQEMLDAMLNLKVFQFVKPTPSSVFGGKTINLPVELVDSLANTSAVVTAKAYTLAIPGAGSISASGVFTASDVQVDTATSVTATFTDDKGKNYTAQTNVTVKALKVSALSINGPSSINSAGTGTYAATASYTDGTTKVVTTSSTWAIASGTIGTLAANVLTAPVVAANASGVIRATYVEKGTTVTATQNVSIIAPANKAFYGAAAIPSGTYSAINWSDFIQTLTPGSTTRATTFAVNLATNQYGWYAAPVAMGVTADTQFLDTDSGDASGGWGGAMSPLAGAVPNSPPRVVSVVINGSTVQYNLFRTDQPSLGSTHWKIN